MWSFFLHLLLDASKSTGKTVQQTEKNVHPIRMRPQVKALVFLHEKALLVCPKHLSDMSVQHAERPTSILCASCIWNMFRLSQLDLPAGGSHKKHDPNIHRATPKRTAQPKRRDPLYDPRPHTLRVKGEICRKYLTESVQILLYITHIT